LPVLPPCLRLENQARMKFLIHNDAKEKWQSFEARLVEPDIFVDLTGFGSNREEAVAELKVKVAARIVQLQANIVQLQAIDYDQVPDEVDYAGKPMKITQRRLERMGQKLVTPAGFGTSWYGEPDDAEHGWAGDGTKTVWTFDPGTTCDTPFCTSPNRPDTPLLTALMAVPVDQPERAFALAERILGLRP
jgi:hypothetical protein